MKALSMTVLLLAAAIAGCIQIEIPESQGAPETSSPTPTASPTPGQAPPPSPKTGNVEGFVRDDDGPVQGAVVTVVGTSKRATTGHDGGFVLTDIAPGQRTVRAEHAATNRSVDRTVEVLEGDTVIAFLTLPPLQTAEDNAPTPPPAPASGFLCEGQPVEERWPTHGQGDDAVAGLTWAALKTGYRFVVAVPGASAFTLDYRAGTDTWRKATSSGPFLVLDGLPEGRDLCFRVTAGGATSAMHAVKLANAGKSWDPESRAYTLNLLIMAAEEPDRAVLEAGLGVYHQALWDATDGHVRPGLTMLVYGPPEWVRYSAEPCSTPGAGINYQPLHDLACAKVFDAGFTYIQGPQAAASTYKDGIQNPRIWVRMNQLWEAGHVFSYSGGDANEVGKVLLHELGHYVFGMDDLYPEAGITTVNCYQAATKISVMGSSRDAREFDGPATPCGNIASGANYVPSWTYLRQRFDQVPERAGPPMPGPEGDGGAALLLVMDLS